MAVLTQGTQLYICDPQTNSILEIECPTAVSGIEASRDQIETTCLNGTSRTYEPGMPSPGQASVTIQFDPAEPSHVRLHELYVAGTKVNWAIGYSDGTAPPTADSNCNLVLPTSRSWIDFNGYVANFPFDFALNTVVTSNISIQLSDFPQVSPKA